MKDIILVGPQGSGKGTQGRILAQKFGYKIFETGAELRNISKENSILGKKVKNIVEAGELVPNEIVMEIVANFCDKLDSGTPVIFDGIPRSDIQKQTLEKLLQEKNRDFFVLNIGLSINSSTKRLLRRAKIENRADDTEEVINKRLENFKKYTKPLLEQWEKEKKLVSVDGEKSIEDVSEKILENQKFFI